MQTIKLLEENIRENTTLSLDTNPKTSMKEKHCKLDLIGGSAGKESACNARDLGWEDPLEKGKASHSSILAWRIPWTIVHGVTKSRTRLSDFHFPLRLGVSQYSQSQIDFFKISSKCI